MPQGSYGIQLDRQVQLKSGSAPRLRPFLAGTELEMRQDEIRDIIANVFAFLRSNPHTCANAKYLVWPVIYAFLCDSFKLFESLGFRDRVALKTASTLAIRPGKSVLDLHARRSVVSSKMQIKGDDRDRARPQRGRCLPRYQPTVRKRRPINA